MQDAQLGDATCIDQDEAEDGPPRVVPVSVGRFLNIGGRGSEREVGVFLVGLQMYQGLEIVHLCTEKYFRSSCPSRPCREILQVCDQWMTEPSRGKRHAVNKKVALALLLEN